jgi:hypothetical protein
MTVGKTAFRCARGGWRVVRLTIVAKTLWILVSNITRCGFLLSSPSKKNLFPGRQFPASAVPELSLPRRTAGLQESLSLQVSDLLFLFLALLDFSLHNANQFD